MPDNKHNMDDLDYLASLGFEQVPVNESDLNELSKKSKRP